MGSRTTELLLNHPPAQVGTVCNDNFDDIAAELICKEMGHLSAASWTSGKKWPKLQKSYDIVLDNVRCSREMQSFGYCDFTTKANCKHAEDIFLYCNEKGSFLI